jgi:hypothetical protein
MKQQPGLDEAPHTSAVAAVTLNRIATHLDSLVFCQR